MQLDTAGSPQRLRPGQNHSLCCKAGQAALPEGAHNETVPQIRCQSLDRGSGPAHLHLSACRKPPVRGFMAGWQAAADAATLLLRPGSDLEDLVRSWCLIGWRCLVYVGLALPSRPQAVLARCPESCTAVTPFFFGPSAQQAILPWHILCTFCDDHGAINVALQSIACSHSLKIHCSSKKLTLFAQL